MPERGGRLSWRAAAHDSGSSLRKSLLAYVVGAWAVLEIVVTVSELAGLPLVVPRVFVLVLVVGLVVVVGVAVAKHRVKVVRMTEPAIWEKRRSLLGPPTVFLALLPGSFIIGDGRDWIMWRDAPSLALLFFALAVAMAVAWWVSARLASAGSDAIDARDPPHT